MLSPKKTEWRKQSRGRMRGQSKGGAMVFSSASLASRRLSPDGSAIGRLMAARIAISRAMSRTGKMWIRVFPG